jgi:hypothetical protein
VSGVRPFESSDLASVVELYERVMRSGGHSPPPGLARYFERTLFEHPWADPEIPSLVYEADDGRILGYMGAHVRRLRFEGEPARMRCAGQLVSDPDERRRAIGAMLMRRFLSGPQDLTITDGATPLVRQMWVGLGGHVLYPGSLVWTRLLRPSRALGNRWLRRRSRENWRAVANPLFAALDAATAWASRPPAPDPDVIGEELTAEALREHQAEVFPGARVFIDYDGAFVGWLFSELEAVRTRGRLTRRLLRRDGELLGWYVAYMQPGGISQAIEVAATRGAAEPVLDHLFDDAWRSRSAAIEGRIEPGLYAALANRRCLLRHGDGALFHSRNERIAAALGLGQSALTRLDGEWWMGHHTEPFE